MTKFYLFTVLLLITNNIYSQISIDNDPHLTFASHFTELGTGVNKMTDWYSYGLKGKVEKIVQKNYVIKPDKQKVIEDHLVSCVPLKGNLENSIISFNYNGNVIDILTKYNSGYYPQTFDYQQGLKEFHDRVSDGYVKGSYQWDEIKGLPLSFEGGIYGHSKYQYQKNLVIEYSYDEAECINLVRTKTFKYKASKNSIEVFINNGDGSFFQRKEIFYNDKGYKVKLVFYNKDELIYFTEHFKYNDKGDIVEYKKVFREDNRVFPECSISYKYDSHNNWILRKEKSSRSDDIIVLERKITYYP